MFVILRPMEVYGILSKDNLDIVENLKELESIDELGFFEDEDGQALNALFELEDEDFKVVFPSFLSTLTESLNAPELRLLALQIIKEDKLNKRDIEKLLNSINKEIKENQNFSDIKKEGLSLFFSTILGKSLEILSEEELVIIPLEKENEKIKTPIYMHESDAGMDIYAKEEITIKPGETKILDTGFKTAVPEGYALLIQPRSGLSAKTKLRIANTPGLIDSGYRENIGVIIENIEPPFKDIDYEFDDSGEIHIKSILHGQSFTISEGQRIAQLRLVKVPKIIFKEVDSIQLVGEDRLGGFGSTGV